jgi:hypothetical protein
MKVYVDAIEEYPVFKVDETPMPGAHEVEMSDDDFAEWRRVEAAYDAWQERLRHKIREKKR